MIKAESLANNWSNNNEVEKGIEECKGWLGALLGIENIIENNVNQLMLLFDDIIQELEDSDSLAVEKYIYLTVILENIFDIIYNQK